MQGATAFRPCVRSARGHVPDLARCRLQCATHAHMSNSQITPVIGIRGSGMALYADYQDNKCTPGASALGTMPVVLGRGARPPAARPEWLRRRVRSGCGPRGAPERGRHTSWEGHHLCTALVGARVTPVAVTVCWGRPLANVVSPR